VPKVVSKLEDEEYFEAFQIIGAETIGDTDILLSEFISSVEHPYLVKLANLSNGREILKASIRDNSRLEDLTVGEMKAMKHFSGEFKVTSVIKPEEVLKAKNDIELEEDDRIVLIGPEDKKEKLDNFFQDQ